ncbi:MAG: hypothetical protein JSW58_12330 [Candidatus Latescibacterota bacterium]|nr:MAG: hypothetical protein JSW58_12330 [Candidatus Latescibacterota bacterium]
MTVQRSFRLLLVVLVTALVSPACYTLIKHPKVIEEGYQQEVRDRQCTNCHYEDEIWSFHHPPNHGSYPGVQYYDWGYYYQVPWWYESYWYYTPSSSETVPLPGRTYRPADDKSQVGPSGRTLGHPPDSKSYGSSVRTKTSDKEKKGDTKNEKSKKRTVRPRGKKEKEDG